MYCATQLININIPKKLQHSNKQNTHMINKNFTYCIWIMTRGGIVVETLLELEGNLQAGA